MRLPFGSLSAVSLPAPERQPVALHQNPEHEPDGKEHDPERQLDQPEGEAQHGAQLFIDVFGWVEGFVARGWERGKRYGKGVRECASAAASAHGGDLDPRLA